MRVGQTANDFYGSAFLQVKRDTALPAVHRNVVMGDLRIPDIGPADKFRGQPPAQVARLTVFNFRDLGTKVAKNQGGKWPLYLLRNLDNFDSFKWLGHSRVLVLRSCWISVPRGRGYMRVGLE